MRSVRGFSVIEALLAVMIIGILSAAVVAYFTPQLGLFFYLPRTIAAQKAGADLLDAVIEGSGGVRGLRYAGPLGTGVNGVIDSGGAVGPTDADTLTYTYIDAGLTPHTVVLQHDAASGRLTRSLDGAAAITLPYGPDSAFRFDAFENVPDSVPAYPFFRYFRAAGTEMRDPVAAIVPASVSRVSIAVRARSGTGTGSVAQQQGDVALKSGVELKNYSGSGGTGGGPVAPSGFTATLAPPTSLFLAWVDNSSDELGFRIQYTTAALGGTFYDIGATSPNATSLSYNYGANTWFGHGVTVTLRIAAVGPAGESYSNTVNVTIP